MGALTRSMHRAAFLVVSLAILYASAQESAVPEDALFALDDDLSEARSTLASMKAAGKTDAECRKLVRDSKEEVTTNVKTEQDILNGLDKGFSCTLIKKEADDERTEAKRTEDEDKKADDELQKAKDHKVVFGTRVFSSLTEGDCGTFFNSDAYINAKQAHTTAVSNKRKAEGAKKQAAETLKKAIAEAKDKTHKCLCNIKMTHSVAFKNAGRNDAANLRTWTMAHRLECVLDEKKGDCTIPALPKVSKPSTAPEVTSAKCTATVQPLPPVDKCQKWKEEHKANQEIAAALSASVGFAPDVTELNADGKRTLSKVADTLKKYAWMTVNVQAHSSASPGKGCQGLVDGRAKSTKEYLASQGVKNTMRLVAGTCGKKRAITIGAQTSVDNAQGAGKPPAGCVE